MTLKVLGIFIFLHIASAIGEAAIAQLSTGVSGESAWSGIPAFSRFSAAATVTENISFGDYFRVATETLRNVLGGLWDMFTVNGYPNLYKDQPFATIHLIFQMFGYGVLILLFYRLITTIIGAVVRRFGVGV